VAANNPEQSTDSNSSKVTSKHVAVSQKQAAQAIEQAGQSPAKRSAAAQTTATEGKPGIASTGPAAATSAGKQDQKPDARKKDSASADDKSTSEHPAEAIAVRANANQPAPNVAAVTATVTADAAVKDSAAESTAKIAKTAAAPKSPTLAAFGRLDREGALSARGPQQAGESPDAPQVDPARFVSRVARAIETAQDRGGPLNLRLSPPELGSMRIELSLKQGVMTAKVETETAAARQTLLDNLPTLRVRLAEQNVRIERFDVDVRRDGNGDQANRGPQQRQFQQHQQFYQTPSGRPALAPTRGAEDSASGPAPTDRTITDTTINLVA
jgi:flagellar hook-length control protein FliK